MKIQDQTIVNLSQQSLLHELVGKLASGSSHAALKNHSRIVNDVPPGLVIKANPEIVSAVIGNMLQTVLHHARDSSIRITAKVYNDIVIVHVKDSNSFDSYGVRLGLQPMQPIAEKMRGYIDVTSQRHKETTIAFSFSNIQVAA